jgi:hypothetical protein
MLTSSVSNASKQLDLVNFSGAEVCSLTAVNMHHMQIRTLQNLKILERELSCQHNARGNNNNSLRCGSIVKTTLNVFDSNKSLAAARRDDDLTLVSSQHSVESTLLVGAKLHNERGGALSMNTV